MEMINCDFKHRLYRFRTYLGHCFNYFHHDFFVIKNMEMINNVFEHKFSKFNTNLDHCVNFFNRDFIIN